MFYVSTIMYIIALSKKMGVDNMKDCRLKISRIIVCMLIMLGFVGTLPNDNCPPYIADTASVNCYLN